MSAHAYTEDQLVEQPAMRLFADLDWSVAQPHPHLGPFPEGEEGRHLVDETGLFGRETKGEVVLAGRLRAALEKLNPSLSAEAITAAIDELTRDRSAMLLEHGQPRGLSVVEKRHPRLLAGQGAKRGTTARLGRKWGARIWGEEPVLRRPVWIGFRCGWTRRR